MPMATYVVSAQTQPCIPILGQKWVKSYIGVYVAGGVSDIQRQQVLLALNVWYSAQQWFIDSFEAGVGTPYLFYLTGSPGEGVITVSFLIGQGLSFAGRALNFAYTVTGDAYVKGEIQINLPPDRASNPTDLEVESIILHELGHGLGLGHSDIPSDAMYAIDNYPQSYGLPSSLDLYAVYMLKQTADPSSLGGSICLPSRIGYGIPPWVQQNTDQNANVISIVYPGGKFTYSYTYSFAASLVVGQGGTFQLNLNDTSAYPVRIVALNAQTDSGQTLIPSESLPQELDPGNQQQFTFQLQGSDTNSVGTHSTSLQLGFQLLTTGGWLSQTDYRTLSANYEVTSAPPQLIQTYTQETRIYPSPSLPAPLIVGAVIVFVILALVAYSATKKPNPSPLTLSKSYCTHCGAQNPVSFDYCGKCGTQQDRPGP